MTACNNMRMYILYMYIYIDPVCVCVNIFKTICSDSDSRTHCWITCVFCSHPYLTSCSEQGTGCKCNCWRRDKPTEAWCWVQERKVAAVTPGHCPMSGECITWLASLIHH